MDVRFGSGLANAQAVDHGFDISKPRLFMPETCHRRARQGCKGLAAGPAAVGLWLEAVRTCQPRHSHLAVHQRNSFVARCGRVQGDQQLLSLGPRQRLHHLQHRCKVFPSMTTPLADRGNRFQHRTRTGPKSQSKLGAPIAGSASLAMIGSQGGRDATTEGYRGRY